MLGRGSDGDWGGERGSCGSGSSPQIQSPNATQAGKAGRRVGNRLTGHPTHCLGVAWAITWRPFLSAPRRRRSRTTGDFWCLRAVQSWEAA